MRSRLRTAWGQVLNRRTQDQLADLNSLNCSTLRVPCRAFSRDSRPDPLGLRISDLTGRISSG